MIKGKIAVAGGTGNVATELLAAVVASKTYQITIFTRSDPPSLTAALSGFTACLSFLIAHTDTNNAAQKNLIHACINAGVRRFAPSEWALASYSGLPAYAAKDEVAEYLSKLKEEGKLGTLEYCLFQPSVFMDYFAIPHMLSAGLHPWPFFVDLQERRAVVLDGGDQPIVITAIADDAEILLRALDDERAWLNGVGGIQGCRTTTNQLMELGKKIRGGEWKVEHVTGGTIEKGVWTASWVPQLVHPALPVEKRG